MWEWQETGSGNPAYNETKDNTKNAQFLKFESNGNYSLSKNIQNSISRDSGTYNTAIADSKSGTNIYKITFTNQRVKDSISYYSLNDSKDTIIFNYGFGSGVVGSACSIFAKQ